jgi:hypothetical protein
VELFRIYALMSSLWPYINSVLLQLVVNEHQNYPTISGKSFPQHISSKLAI